MGVPSKVKQAPAGTLAHNLREVLTYRIPMVDLLLTKVASSIYSRRAGLTVYQWKVLAAIGTFGPLPAAEIARRATVDKAAVSRSVRQLMDKKLIKRVLRDGNDPVLQLLLTPAGQAAFEGIISELGTLQTRLLQGLDKNGRAALFEGLLILEDNLRDVQDLPPRMA